MGIGNFFRGIIGAREQDRRDPDDETSERDDLTRAWHFTPKQIEKHEREERKRKEQPSPPPAPLAIPRLSLEQIKKERLKIRPLKTF